jgi:hypothetical protein
LSRSTCLNALSSNSETYLNEKIMPFINELIPEDFKKSFDFRKIKKPSESWTPKDMEFSSMWTIDHERDTFLLHLKSGGRGLPDEPTHKWFAFYSQGDLLYFEADHIESTDETGRVLTWTNPMIIAAIEPAERREEVIKLFHAALDEMGVLWNRSWVDVVKLGDMVLGQGGNQA